MKIGNKEQAAKAITKSTARLTVVALMILSAMALPLSAKEFVVVIDPGHGGKDPGAIGRQHQEKTINLNVAKRLGALIEQNNDDVKVVYTRTTDKYVTLKDRPTIANEADGDLFISIHTNSVESQQAYGAETYTLGLSKSNANFEVAKRENSVLLLEEGNSETYQGFDPTSPESYIMFEFMQSKYIDQSVEIAYYVQQEFISAKRLDRGVRQAIFWVLHQVKMPSILIELGFISNPSEEKFLGSVEGQTKMASSIYAAFEKYKHEYDKRTITQLKGDAASSVPAEPEATANEEANKEKPTPNASAGTEMTTGTDKKGITAQQTSPKETQKEYTKQETNAATKSATEKSKTDTSQANKDNGASDKKNSATPAKHDEIIFRIQTFSTKYELPENHDELRKLSKYKPIYHITELGWYKYYCTSSATWKEAEAQLAEIRKLHKDAFIVAFKNGLKITITDDMKK